MSSYHEAVKRVLSEISKFLKVTLQSEKLSSGAENERSKLVTRLQRLFADYDSLAPSSGDEGSISSATDRVSLSNELSADGSHGSEEDSYADNIPDTTVKALSEPSKMGYLERRQEILFASSWSKRYCVLHRNVFYIFKKPSDKKQQGAFIVTGYEFREAPYFGKDDKKKDCYFELVCPAKKSYQFLCESKEDLQAWKEVLQSASKHQPVAEHANDEDIYEDFNEKDGQNIDEIYDDATTEKPAATAKLPPGPSAAPVPVSKLPPVPSAAPVPASKLPPVPSVAPVPVKVSPVSPALPVSKTDQKKNPDAEEDDLVYECVESPAGPPSKSGVGTQGTVISAALPPPPLPFKTSGGGHAAVSSTSPHKEQEAAPPPVPPHRGSDLQPPVPPGRGDQGQMIPPPLPGRSLPPPPTSPLPAVPSPSKKVISPTLGKILHPSEDYENLFYGKWDCTGSTGNELSFKRGQIVHVISRDLDKDDWWVGALDDKIGLVPKSYLCPAYELVR